jgi:peptidoglycan/xylan/chitin deacetylase (PgdA/CDA1 family)
MLWYQSIPAWFQNLFPRLIWQVPGKNTKDIYLTFDDGPHPEISVWVEEQLSKHNMKATFFCVGDNLVKHSETARYLENKGQILANHTMHHLKGWSTPTEEYVQDVEACNIHLNTFIFRPPYGRIKKKQINALYGKFKIIMWSVLSCDFDQNLNTKKALKGLIKKTKNGSIVVFHDSLKAEKNLKILLPPYLKYIHQQGFVCKTF